MTEKKIKLILKDIEECKKDGHHLEALLINYHLNLDILKLIASKVCAQKPEEGSKAKHILECIIEGINSESRLKTTINKKNLKMLKPWLAKMDLFFKSLKLKRPTNSQTLLNEGEKIFAVLNLSATKIFVGNC